VEGATIDALLQGPRCRRLGTTLARAVTGLAERVRALDDDCDESPVPELVAAALDGDQGAWNRLVERYTLLVLSIVRRHRLQEDDAEDVIQTVWLRLVENLGNVRQPQALPGWIVTTARNECLRLIKARRSVSPTDLTNQENQDAQDDDTIDAGLLGGERHEALLTALAELGERQRALLLALIEDPPLSYEAISGRLGIPIGSIGPTRARALARLRAHPAMRALLEV
jgi:RNA polymerase sigma factor (sigma-70 family)